MSEFAPPAPAGAAPPRPSSSAHAHPDEDPSATADARPAPPVLAILVSHNGASWVLGALRTLRAQRYPNLRILAVDNASTDTTGEILRRRLDEEQVLRLDQDRGFGRAVAAALKTEYAQDAPYVLLVHDDMALMPDAVQWLVDALEQDPATAIVGPKLREWDEEPLLQQVGMMADVFGRAERQLSDDELDQGQHDTRGDMLWVSTAGMLLRREVFTSLGGFDARFDLFADDLDLCWRVWLSGRRVAVVPTAVGYHRQATTHGVEHRREPADIRFRVERHTLATLLKNYSGRRLAWVLPLGAVLNVLRLLGMLLSRRFGEAAALIRAYLWNLAQLPSTLRRRRAVQAIRRQPDRALTSLFATGLPRFQQYSDALMETIAGGSTRALVDADDITISNIDPLAEQPMRRFLRDRSLLLLGLPLLLAFLLSLGGFVGDGPIIGGDIAAWPDSPMEFLRAYLSPWGGQPLASVSFPSPIQAVLGLGSFLFGGSAWLAQRVLVFGLIPLAFVVTLRAGRLVTSRSWPRVIGAAVYVTSPAVLGTLSEGRYGIAVLASLLPGLVALTIRTADPNTPPGVAWRSTALLSLNVLLILGAAPVEGLIAPAVVAIGVLVAMLRGWIRPLLRLVVGGLSAVLMLSPWLVDVLRDGGPGGRTLATDGGPAASISLPVWRALTFQPEIVDLDTALTIGLLAVPAAVLLGALVVGLRSRPLITGALLLLTTASGAGAWAAAYYRIPLVWPPALLLPGAVALAVLAMIATRWSAQTLAASDFGVGQVGTGLAGIAITVGLGAGMLLMATGPWTALQQNPQLVPAFIGADTDQLGEYRVLLLDRADDGTVRWEVTDSDGPSMVSFGTIRSRELTEEIDRAVLQAVSGVGNGPGATLGLLNVRYVVLQSPDAQIQEALAGLRDLEPLPSSAAVTYRVRSWVPRASVISEPDAARLLATGDPGPRDGTGEGALTRAGPAEFRGGAGGATSGLLVLSEADSAAWRAAGPDGALDAVPLPPVTAFQVPEQSEALFRIVSTGGLRRRVVVAIQVVLVLVVISLAIRPPGSRTEEEEPTSMPTDLVGLADATTVIPRIDPSKPPPGSTGGGA